MKGLADRIPDGPRLAKAAALLRQSVPPKYIAADLQLTDEAHLSRVFRRRYGALPRAWALQINDVTQMTMDELEPLVAKAR